MSIEQALSENTAALRTLAANLAAFFSAASAATGGTADKMTVQIAVDASAAKEVVAAAIAGVTAEEKQAVVATVRFFKNTAKGTTFKVLPTDPQVDLKDSVEISEADFLALQQAASTPTPASGAASAASSPTVTAEAPAAAAEVTAEKMTEACRDLFRKLGNPALQDVLRLAGVQKVPHVPAEKRQVVYDAAVKALKAATQ